MIQIVPKIRLINPENEFMEEIQKIKLRGYLSDEPVAISGGMKWAIESGEIKPLSVDKIVSFTIGREKPLERTWGQDAGVLVHIFLEKFLDAVRKKPGKFLKRCSYSSVREKTMIFAKKFLAEKSKLVKKLGKRRTMLEEDEKFLIRMLEFTTRYEISIFLINKLLGTKKSVLDPVNLCTIDEIKPDSRIIGISSPSTPDFLISELATVGDIKTGSTFEDHFRLTCAGYALAYENEKGKGHEINFGVIYLFPTRSRTISFAQTHVFLIDDVLRREFLDRRNDALKKLIRGESSDK